MVTGASPHRSGRARRRRAVASCRRGISPGIEGQAALQGLTLLPAGCIRNPPGRGPKRSGSRRDGLGGLRTPPIIQIPPGGGCPWQARENRLASAAGKQDDSGVHHATVADGNQDVSVAAAVLAGPGTKEETVSQL